MPIKTREKMLTEEKNKLRNKKRIKNLILNHFKMDEGNSSNRHTKALENSKTMSNKYLHFHDNSIVILEEDLLDIIVEEYELKYKEKTLSSDVQRELENLEFMGIHYLHSIENRFLPVIVSNSINKYHGRSTFYYVSVKDYIREDYNYNAKELSVIQLKEDSISEENNLKHYKITSSEYRILKRLLGYFKLKPDNVTYNNNKVETILEKYERTDVPLEDNSFLISVNNLYSEVERNYFEVYTKKLSYSLFMRKLKMIINSKMYPIQMSDTKFLPFNLEKIRHTIDEDDMVVYLSYNPYNKERKEYRDFMKVFENKKLLRDKENLIMENKKLRIKLKEYSTGVEDPVLVNGKLLKGKEDLALENKELKNKLEEYATGVKILILESEKLLMENKNLISEGKGIIDKDLIFEKEQLLKENKNLILENRELKNKNPIAEDKEYIFSAEEQEYKRKYELAMTLISELEPSEELGNLFQIDPTHHLSLLYDYLQEILLSLVGRKQASSLKGLELEKAISLSKTLENLELAKGNLEKYVTLDNPEETN